MKVLWIDTETTGLEPGKHGIVQLAMIIEIDHQVAEEQTFAMNPVGKERSPEAMAIHGITEETLATYEPATEVKPKIAALWNKYVSKYDRADKFTVGGYNVDFDVNHLEALWKECGDTYFRSYIGPGSIDPFKALPLLEYAGLIDHLPSKKLADVALALGVELSDAHDAASDIRATREIAHKIVDLMRRGVGLEGIK
jgi:DNA polymerase-3 subunit epsilon